MRTILLATVVAMLPASLALAQQSGTVKLDQLKLDQPVASDKLLPLKEAGSSNPCAGMGPDFVRVAGTDSCIRIGGAVRIGVGGSVGSR